MKKALRVLSKKAALYDIRSVHKVRWCTDTWNGSVHPMDGMVWDTVLAPRISDSELVNIGSFGRWFDHGSREARGASGNTELAELLLNFASQFKALASAIYRVAHATEVKDKEEKVSHEKLNDDAHLQIFLKHPIYTNMMLHAKKEHTPIIIEFDETQGIWTITQK